MATILLISIKDIQEYRPVADITDDRVTPYIREAQESDLRPVLNNALYLDLVKNFEQPKYQDLLFGKEWTFEGQLQQFNGLRPMLVYHSLARLILNNQINVTAFGVVQKTVNGSQVADPDSVRAVVTELRSIAAGYQKDLCTFLVNNSTTYPLYNTLSHSSNGNKTGLKFFRA